MQNVFDLECLSVAAFEVGDLGMDLWRYAECHSLTITQFPQPHAC